MKNRIKELREQKGINQDALAEFLKITQVSMSRIENGRTKLTEQRIEQIMEYFDVPVSDIFEKPLPFRMVAVKGAVQAGEWAENPQWPPDEWYSVPVPESAGVKGCKLYGAEARGPSMNERYPDGSIVIFTDTIETREDVIVGKRYVVERERSDGLREATVKKLWQDDDGTYWLLPESNDPRFQEPIPVNGDDGDIVRIVGRVIYSVNRE